METVDPHRYALHALQNQPGMGNCEYDPLYLGYFECFNHERFFEAHDVLEALWLPQRNGPNGDFYKGLIQLAGAFVHWQKNRPGPAGALFKLATANLQRYPVNHEGLEVSEVLARIERWQQRLAATPEACPPLETVSPHVALAEPRAARQRVGGESAS